MSIQHTQGPWELIEFDRVDRPGRIVGDNGIPVASVSAPSRNDARLIAAAPELLSAVQLALRALNVAPRFEVPGAGDSYEVCSELERVLRKVEGAA